MKTLVKLALLAGAVALVWAFITWPRINDVETGKTPEYPDLKPKMYAASVARVAKASEEAIAHLPRWSLVGSGSGPGGHAIQAVSTTRLWRFNDDVTIRIYREGPWTYVTVRSKSRVGKGDFGQNARNIRAFLTELDRLMS
jgi:uncharacterized protein (DUF1499 family)